MGDTQFWLSVLAWALIAGALYRLHKWIKSGLVLLLAVPALAQPAPPCGVSEPCPVSLTIVAGGVVMRRARITLPKERPASGAGKNERPASGA